MAGETSEIEARHRSTLSRIGVTLLNLPMPGLGLLRLGKVGPALFFPLVQLLGICLLWVCYAAGPTLTYVEWISILAVGGTLGLLLYIGSIAMTWRSSRQVLPRSGWLWRWYGIIAVWLGILVVISPLTSLARRYYRNFVIPAASMVPNLQVGDRFVAKMQGYDPLRRGDVVVVRKGSTEYVKRIVAIAGDHVMMVAGKLVLNGSEVAQHAIAKSQVDYVGGRQTATVLEEQLPGESRPHQIVDIEKTPQDNWPGVTLGTNQFVLLGDNRDNSLDSRFSQEVGGLGVVTRQQIEGRALFRYWRRGSGIAEGTI